MTTFNSSTLMADALRLLDPAASTDLTSEEAARAHAMLTRIVTSPSDAPLVTEPARRHRRRTGALVTLVLAGAAGVAIPTLFFGGTAYGSWTPKPQALDATAATAAASTCRAALDVKGNADNVAVAEKRGDWTYILLSGPETEAVCLMPNTLIGKSAGAKHDFFGSYDTDVAAPSTVASSDIDETASTQGSTNEGWFVSTEGYVGASVTGVTVHTSSGLDIEASVVGGRFAAWWPASAQSSDRDAETWSYTLQLADGRTRNAPVTSDTDPGTKAG